MSLRPARLQDASSLAALSIEVWIGTYLKTGITGFFADYALSEFTAQKMEAILGSPQDQIIVSQNTTGIDGFIRISQNQPAPDGIASDTEIATFYVQPRHHGKGIGKALLNAALGHCTGPVWLATNSENTPAIQFYLSQGFSEVGQTFFRLQDQAYRNSVFLR